MMFVTFTTLDLEDFDCLVFSTIFQSYHGVSWVSYQYNWAIFPDISQLVVILTLQS